MERKILIKKITDFLEEIGIKIKMTPIVTEGFLPGLKIVQGTLLIDIDNLLYPGDILHEAGHLACMPPSIRAVMDGELENNNLNQGGELMALCWSYAACVYLKIDPSIVFHEFGYKGGSKNLIDNFKTDTVIGLPLLQWVGMAFDKKQGEINKTKPYPHMVNWLCKQERS